VTTTTHTPEPHPISRWLFALIPFAALIILMPMFHHGISCGHDLTFHITNWVEVSQQWRQGIVFPRWAVSPNYTAGEPRFIFYPPASTMLGAALGEITGWAAAPFVFLFVVLCAAGAAMYRFARLSLLPAAALTAALLYIANPYTLFVIYTRSAYAELVAAAILPLLFLAVLRPRIHIALVAETVAGLWLANAPAAVIGMYALLVLALLAAWRHRSLQHLLRIAAGTALGFAVAAIYIIPAAYERSWVQIDRVKQAAYEFRNNFLFGHMGEPMHDHVLHQASWIAVILLAVIAISTAVLLLQRRHWHVLQRRVFFLLAILSAVILFLLLPISAFAWQHVPELAFLQFPWRWTLALAPIAALLLAAALSRVYARWVPIVLALLVLLFSHHAGYHNFHQACDPEDTPRGIVASLDLNAESAGLGQEGTDEYTPIGADTDDLQHDAPRVWLYNAAELPELQPAKHVELPQHPTIIQWSPEYKHFSVDVPENSIAILQLMDYPAWQVRVHTPGAPADSAFSVGRYVQQNLWKVHPASSGQLQIRLPAGRHDVEVKFDHTGDRILADVISGLSMLLLAWVAWRERHYHAHLRHHAHPDDAQPLEPPV